MRKLVALSLFALAAGAGAAQAQYYYGPGPYYGPPPGYYDGPPQGYYRRGGPDAPIYSQDNFGNPEVWFRPVYTPYGPRCRQAGYTVQDGYCKRYRGY